MQVLPNNRCLVEYPISTNDQTILLDEFESKKEEINTKVYEFVNDSLRNFQIETPSWLFEHIINELVKNAYDSFVDKGLKMDEKLQITAVVSEKTDQIILKFKDNGTGFKKLEKGEKKTFQVNDTEVTLGTDFISSPGISDKKDTKKYLGGAGCGMQGILANLKDYNPDVTVYAKNRKLEGCAIHIVFPKSQH